jgi:hypothetical protein
MYVSDNLEQFVGLQVEAVDGLASQMTLLRTKMTLYKEQRGTEKFSEYRDAVDTPRWEVTHIHIHIHMHICLRTNTHKPDIITHNTHKQPRAYTLSVYRYRNAQQ